MLESLVKLDDVRIAFAGKGNLYDLLQAIIDEIPIVDPIVSTGGCYCYKCKRKNSPACPAYDSIIGKTPLKMKYCSEGRLK